MPRSIFAAIALLAATAFASPAGAAPLRPVVIELFTSEGCSSCPPADRFLTDLVQDHSDILALAFHVTYWNSLGWHDPFSLQASTARQSDYAAAFNSGAVFTPQMVVDGARSVVGSNRSDALAAIAEARARPAGAKVALTADGAKVKIGIGAGEGPGRVLLVGFDREHTTAVGRGENSGRTLKETNVVRSVSNVADWTGAAISLSVAPPAGEKTAVLLQTADGRIVGAAALDR